MPQFTEEQQLAVDIEGSNVLVSAGAGSGKTEVLSERVLRKIKDGTSIDNLLVLTFTNAAAAEMKERIRDKIGKVDHLKEEFEKVEASYIVTFDAFTLAIVKKYHYLKNLNKDISVVDASIINIKKKEILDNLFETYYEKEDEKFLELIKTYCYKNDDEVKEFVKKAQNQIELFYDKKEFLNNFIENYYSENMVNDLKTKYENLILSKLEDLKIMYHNLYLADETYALKTDIEKLLLSKSYEEVFKNIPEKMPRIPNNSEEEFKTIKDEVNECLEKVRDLLKKECLEDYITDYKATKKYAETFIMLIKKYDELIENFKFENNLYEFLDIAKLAIEIVKENEDVRLYYKNKFSEILIDEYQDTSDLQEIFINLIEKNNVYMVGDIKQSIYRFRNANPDIFRMKFNNYGKNVGGRRVDLNKNFRSREEVLDNINLIFNFLMDDKIGGADYEKEHKLVFGNKVYETKGKTLHSNDFEVLNYTNEKESDYTDAEVEIFAIAKDIEEKVSSNYQVFDKKLGLRACTYSDFAILIDKSKNFDLIKKIFNYKNIPTLVIKDESIKESVILKIIKNIFILVNQISLKKYDEKFTYAFVSVSRSFLCSISDDEIFDIVKSKNFSDTTLFNKLLKLSNGLNEKNIFDLINEIIEEFDLYEKIILIGSLDDNNAVIEFLIDFCSNYSNFYSVEDFIKYLDNITIGDIDIKYSLSASSADSVKIMTIHKSKGLEYPVVYFPFLKDEFNTMDIKGKFTFNKKIGFIMPIKNDMLELSFTKEILKNEFLLDDISEKLRLFYVALTRAREKFIFVMNFENKKDYQLIDGLVSRYDRMKYKSFKNILESVNKVLYEYIKNIDIDSLNLTHDYDFVKKSNYKDILVKGSSKINPIKKEFKIEQMESKHFSKSVNTLFSNSEKENINNGKFLHKVMEDFDFYENDILSVDEKYQNVVRQFLDTKIIDNFLNIYKEYEFIYNENNELMHGIIDLLIEKENEYIIVDYKLKNTGSKEYINQMKGYKNYIGSLTSKTVKIYLYSLIEGTLRSLE